VEKLGKKFQQENALTFTTNDVFSTFKKLQPIVTDKFVSKDIIIP